MNVNREHNFRYSVQIKRFENGLWRTMDDSVTEEVIARVFVNGRMFGSLVCSPWDLDELVIGYLFNDGIIRCNEDILDCSVKGNDVFLRLGRVSFDEPVIPPHTDCCFTPETVIRLVSELEDASYRFRHTGGVHAAALADGSQLLTRCEDIGRHNTLDRLVGRCLINHISMAGRAVVFTGRVPNDIVQKIARVGCSAMFSVSAPTSMAIETAEAADITLVSFVRDNRFNVYVHPSRILQAASARSSL